jgi:hypothetical protein
MEGSCGKSAEKILLSKIPSLEEKKEDPKKNKILS